MSRVGTRRLWQRVSSMGKCRDLSDIRAPSWPHAADLKYEDHGNETCQPSPGVTGVCCSAVGDSRLPNQRLLNAHILVDVADGGLGEGTCLHESLLAHAGDPAILGAGMAGEVQ